MKKKTALITGGSGGIGSEICIKLANIGFNIVMNYYDDLPGLDEFSDKLRTIANFIIIKADISNEQEVLKLKKNAEAEFGHVDVLVNNAGIYPRRSFEKLDLKFWEENLKINLTSHFICSKVFSQSMIKLKAGSIINIGSVLSRMGRKDLLPYISAKSGMEGLTKSLAIELGEYNIRCNCILPGSIQVPHENSVIDDYSQFEERQMRRQCIKRRGTPEDIANIVGFLSTEESSFITGQSICVDGGWFFNEK